MVKKLFVTFSVFISVTLLAACGSGNDSTVGEDTCPVYDVSEYLNVDLDSKPTIDFLGPYADYDPAKDPTADVVEEVTGYEVNYKRLPSTNAEQTLNTQLGTGEQYHAVKVTRNQYENLVKQCALLDISDYLDQYGENIKNAISEESWSVVEYGDGIYGVPERSSSDNINSTIAFRQDWLDALDLEVPETPEELKAVLQAFKDEYGQNDPSFAPLTLQKSDIVIYAISSAFGIYTEWKEIDGELYHQTELEAMQEYLDFMIELEKDGLLDVAVPTNDNAKAEQKFTQGRAGAIVTYWWRVPSLVDGLESSAEIGAELSYAEPLKDEEGNRGILRSTGVNYVTVIPVHMAEQAAYAIDWMDKKLVEENFKKIVIGSEDVHHIIDREGNYLPGNKFDEKNNSDYFITGSYEPKYDEFWLARVHKNEDMYNAWYALNEKADEYGKYEPLAFAPALPVTSDKKHSLAVKQTDQFINMIFTDNSIDSYDNFLNDWKQSGGEATHEEVNDWYDNKN
ncbi:extracellular solute-binding protein [Haloplasma contractile]|uniref:Family 1 extracellular solute-binding protein n=1 Tax=Haloplasma contractile SSD-17B TaxID=1033810 RepID=U2FLM6_9MOLU|nr:extracellular solute-binding protein [Haloplasma contractile]ERJ13650.1 family 1 extracellular solute-binding protein [Haloplasma contractile SSD-17B]